MIEERTNFPNRKTRRYLAVLFIVAALWNFAGSVPGLFDPGQMFTREFGRPLTDPVLLAVYRGAWGTAFIYGFGFLLVALNPVRHVAVVLMGGTGKALFALNLFFMWQAGWTSSFAVVVILGDVVFVALFVAYLITMKRSGAGVLL